MKPALSQPSEVIPRTPIFPSFFGAGFECSTHRLRSGKRLDLIAATRHDEFAQHDYERLQRRGPFALDLAARREYCDWELTPRVREDGYALLIPDIQEFRVFGHALALRARLDMLDGKLD